MNQSGMVIPNILIHLSLASLKWDIGNIVDPDQTPLNAASD